MRSVLSLKAACVGSKVLRSSGMRVTRNFWNLPGLEWLQSTLHSFHGVFTCQGFHLSCHREKGWSLKAWFVFGFPTRRHPLAVMFTPDNQMSEQSEGNSGARKLELCGTPTQTTSFNPQGLLFPTQDSRECSNRDQGCKKSRRSSQSQGKAQENPVS